MGPGSSAPHRGDVPPEPAFDRGGRLGVARCPRKGPSPVTRTARLTFRNEGRADACPPKSTQIRSMSRQARPKSPELGRARCEIDERGLVTVRLRPTLSQTHGDHNSSARWASLELDFIDRVLRQSMARLEGDCTKKNVWQKGMKRKTVGIQNTLSMHVKFHALQ